MALSPSAHRARPLSTRKRVLVMAGLLLLVAIVGLGLLALRLADVRGEAEAARADLTEAMSALRTGDIEVARDRVDSARTHVDSARGRVDGFAGDVWSLLPVAGTAVEDVRHLVHALDDATAVAEIGIDVYPSIVGKQATLFRDEQLDLATLAEVITGLREAGGRLRSAEQSLSQVQGVTPVIGDMIAARSDEAAAQVTPMVEAYSQLEPLLGELPGIFGADGRRTYLIAMLNPAELRYSGGAALSFAPMSWDQGRLELGDSITPFEDPRLRTPISWPKVEGNTFHDHRRVEHLVNSTLAPSWSVSGTELLRAWQSARHIRHDGLLAVDVVALSELLGSSGPITVPGYGSLTEANLVEKLVGSYDDYYPDPTAQDTLSESIIPVFKTQLFSGGNYVAKLQVLKDAADGRHFATFFHDDEVQAGMAALGLDGDLAPPEGDYLGVFTQNRNISKTDYYQRRSVALDVTLDGDGSADHRLDVVVHNDTPPYAHPGVDPRTGYFTRWAGMTLGVFLPDGVAVGQASTAGAPWKPTVENFYEHDFVRNYMLLEPGAQRRVTMTYRVPAAATVDESGELTYRLAVDPQGTVNPASLTVRVQLPRGYRAPHLPDGWTAEGGTISFQTSALESTQTWEIPLHPDS